MDSLFGGEEGRRLRIGVFVVVVLLGVFLGIKALAELSGLRYIGTGSAASNTITVSGYGEAYAAADVATFTFSVVSLKSTVAAAQTEATEKINAITAYLKEAGIEDKDIQTSNYSIYPQYDYESMSCSPGVYCPPGRQVLRGYEVRQSTTVKVRDTAKAGDLLAGVGTRGATEVSGLSFTFDDKDAIEDEARGKAIADARAEADELAKQLGVRLVRVVSFSENGGGFPLPYARDVLGMGGAANETKAAVAPAISVGENQVVSNVTVTYEIR